jgi:hypothetical protein
MAALSENLAAGIEHHDLDVRLADIEDRNAAAHVLTWGKRRRGDGGHRPPGRTSGNISNAKRRMDRTQSLLPAGGEKVRMRGKERSDGGQSPRPSPCPLPLKWGEGVPQKSNLSMFSFV